MKKKKEIDEAILKVALGCTVEEITEEYAEVDGDMRLVKMRKTEKNIPPDLKAVQLLLQGEDRDVSTLSDEELEKEKIRLIEELKSQNGNYGVSPEKKEKK